MFLLFQNKVILRSFSALGLLRVLFNRQDVDTKLFFTQRNGVVCAMNPINWSKRDVIFLFDMLKYAVLPWFSAAIDWHYDEHANEIVGICIWWMEC